VSRLDLPQLPGLLTAEDVLATAAYIASTQERSGAIPWFRGGHVDAWDHVECAMALSVAGRYDEAVAAYDYLRRTQRTDGSWPAKVIDGVVVEADAETNHCAYVAVGVWHHFVLTSDEAFARRMWPTVHAALEFVANQQTDRGEIRWSVREDGRAGDEALLTGSASTLQSLRCGLALAYCLGNAEPEWEFTAGSLLHVLRAHPEAFLDKSRYSMDWYYPILGGALRGREAHDRIDERWQEFVVPGLGARCVSDQPWVTGAETCELVLTLDTIGRRDEALTLLGDMQHLREPDGSYWTGYQFHERINWPDEHSTWTSAAVVLAVDALSATTPAHGIFRGETLPEVAELPVSACGCGSTVGASQ
jgi:hypothetical protein